MICNIITLKLLVVEARGGCMNRFTNAYCNKMRNGGKCTARGMFGAKKMKRNCRETCGFCGGKI